MLHTTGLFFWVVVIDPRSWTSLSWCDNDINQTFSCAHFDDICKVQQVMV